MRPPAKCEAKRYERGWAVQCSRKATVTAPGGKGYCAQHDPEAVERRRKAAVARIDAQIAATDERYRREAETRKRADLYPALLSENEALKARLAELEDLLRAAQGHEIPVSLRYLIIDALTPSEPSPEVVSGKIWSDPGPCHHGHPRILRGVCNHPKLEENDPRDDTRFDPKKPATNTNDY